MNADHDAHQAHSHAATTSTRPPSAATHAGHAAGPEAHEHGGHDQHEGHSPEMFRDRFWLSFALTVPVVVWSEHIQELLGYRAPRFTGSDWIGPALGPWCSFTVVSCSCAVRGANSAPGCRE